MVYRPAQVADELEGVAPEPEAELEVASITVGGRQHRLKKATTVLGRSKDADVQVQDPNVSRRHAELRREGARYILSDLDSTNGIEVEGKRIKELELEDGMRFTLGSTELVFSVAGPARPDLPADQSRGAR